MPQDCSKGLSYPVAQLRPGVDSGFLEKALSKLLVEDIATVRRSNLLQNGNRRFGPQLQCPGKSKGDIAVWLLPSSRSNHRCLRPLTLLFCTNRVDPIRRITRREAAAPPPGAARSHRHAPGPPGSGHRA